MQRRVLFRAVNAFRQTAKIHILAFGGKRSAHRHKIAAVFDRHDFVRRQFQRLNKTLAKLGQEIKRPAQKCDMPTNRTPLRQIANGLVDHRLENRKRDVGFLHTVVNQRLDIRFREHAAAGRNRINLPPFFRQRIESQRVRRKKRRHVIDERTGAARAYTVHSLLRRAAEIRDFRVLSAEFHRRVRLWNQRLHRRSAGNDFLHERKPDALCNAHARRARQGKGKTLRAHNVSQRRQILMQCLADFRKMARIFFINDFFRLIQHDDLDCRRAYVNANA